MRRSRDDKEDISASRSSLGSAATTNNESSGYFITSRRRFRLDVIKHARFIQPTTNVCTCILRVAFLVISTGSGECMTSHAHVRRAFIPSRRVICRTCCAGDLRNCNEICNLLCLSRQPWLLSGPVSTNDVIKTARAAVKKEWNVHFLEGVI